MIYCWQAAPAPSRERKAGDVRVRQDSSSSFMSVMTRSRAESVEGQETDCFHSTEDLHTQVTANLYCCQIHLKAGHDLSIKDSCGTSDPYVKFFHDGKMVYKSKTVYKDLNPFWDEKFDLIIEDVSVPLDLKVYDYDWGLRDDFMGQAQIVLSPGTVNREEEELVVSLVEAGQSQYLGQVSLTLKLSTILPSTPLHRRVSQAVTVSPARGIEMTARRLGRANWSSVVNILLVEGRDLLAMDEEGTSDPYCKFRYVMME